MLHIGLTGGIGAGKSTIAKELAILGAHLIDADQLARDVVAPGSAGLEKVAAAFGPSVLLADGSLDRAKLGQRVFSSPEELEALNAIVHPLVRELTARRVAELPTDAIVVHDVPLLVEKRMDAQYHLVLVVGASRAKRTERLLASREMTEAEINRRMAAQASDEQRRAVADIWLDNEVDIGSTTNALRQVWYERLAPYAANLIQGRPAVDSGLLTIVDEKALSRPWSVQAEQIASRILHRFDRQNLDIRHIGATAIPGLRSADVVELQLAVATLEEANALTAGLAAAGYPLANSGEVPTGSEEFRAWWSRHPQHRRRDRTSFERIHTSADPGRHAVVYVRQTASAPWAYPLLLRDWLRSDATARADFARMRARWAGASVSRETFDAQCAAYLRGVTPAALEWAERNWCGPEAG